MKNYLVLLAGAAALSLASCSQEKAVETTTTTPATTDMATTDMDASADARAQRVADRMAADMNITDEATKTRMRDAYASRTRRMSEMRTRYATDTMGMAAAMRESDMQMDNDYRSIFTDPNQYQSYQTNRSTYYTMGDEDMGSSMSGSMDNSTMNNGGTMSSDGGMMDNNVKTKVKSDGDVKMKDAEGNKMKVAGDDGTVKYKPEDGQKVKVE